MRSSSSKERLDLLHQALDRELENITKKPVISRQKQSENCNQYVEKRALQQTSIKNTQYLQKSRKNQISELQKKLHDLEKKIGSFSDSQEESFDKQITEKLEIKKIIQKPILKKKQAQSSEQDSFDYYAVSKTEPFKQKISKEQIEKEIYEDQQQIKIEPVLSKKIEIDQKIKEQVYSSKLNHSQISKKSLEKKSLVRRQSKQSLKSQKKRIESSKDFDKYSIKSIQHNNYQADKIRIKNLQHELSHYKRLCAKLKDKIQQMHVNQIEYRELKNNFAKSEQIRFQQKKIIKTLKDKIK